jgi:hypothetical protein
MFREKRQNVKPIDEIEELVVETLGAALPDRLVAFTGAARRNCERWLSGDSAYPEGVVADLERLAPLSQELWLELQGALTDFRAHGMPDHLIRMRMREFSKTLSEKPEVRSAT